MPPSPEQFNALRAMLDRLIPADEFPGALAASTDHYILRQLDGDCAAEAAALLLGLTQLDLEAAALRRPRVTFATLSAVEQDALLCALEQNRPATLWPEQISAAVFFSRFVELAHEGFYADPANGGNRDSVSWTMLGFDPRLPKS